MLSLAKAPTGLAVIKLINFTLVLKKDLFDMTPSRTVRDMLYSEYNTHMDPVFVDINYGLN